MSRLRFVKSAKDERREVIFLDSWIAGDITPNATGPGGWLHLFGPGAQSRSARTMRWPQHCADRAEARKVAEQVLLT